MKLLKTEIHPDKTWLGRVKNGFGFLGFRITPTSIYPSTGGASRREKKIARIYKQDASNKRIGQYLRRWLGWSVLAVITSMTTANAADPGPSCGIRPIGDDLLLVSAVSISDGAYVTPESVTIITSSFTEDQRNCLSDVPPNATACQTEAVGGGLDAGETLYYSSYDFLRDRFCAYELISDGTNITATNITAATFAATTPTAVPIFTPLGLAATIGGLLWFGRRKAMKVTQN